MSISEEVLEAYGRRKLDDVLYWVYVLDCKERWFIKTFDKWEAKVEKRLGYKPDWLRQAWEANRCVYVGQTENLEKRLGQHFKNQNSSDFTTVYEPTHIQLLEPKNNRQSAEYSEKKRAEAYYDTDTFAYWS